VHAWDARFPAVPARFVRLVNAELAFWSGEWVIGELDVLVPASERGDDHAGEHAR
jgi:hypothetical protein